MARGEGQQPAPGILSPRIASLVSGAIILVIAFADSVTPANIVLPILYGVPLLIYAWVRRPVFLWAMALILVGLTFLFFSQGPPRPVPEINSIALLNRVMAALATLLTAALVHLWIRSEKETETHQRMLKKNNSDLETINQELGRQEEEIVRQNEELQSQTEELERQSEELRITNEELAGREKVLEHLLELSRSLTADLSRGEMLKKICEAIEVLTNGSPSAILEKEGDELIIPCHHGFGPEGAQAERIPFGRAFASLVMSLGQAGYLEDVQQRPDLFIPQPRKGLPFRSVLSSPLRVRSRCVGTIELYGHAPQSWSKGQIAMLESLAAQASISLQSAELIEAIQREQRRFEAAFRTVPFGLAVADDPLGQHVRLNPAGAAMLNVSLDENIAPSTPIGSRLKRFFYRGEQPLPEDQLPLVRALQGNEIEGEDLQVVFPGGKRLALLVSAGPIFDGKNKVSGAVWAFADITSQKLLQHELDRRRREAEEANVRKTRFLAAVSHDIRTPANAINLMAEVIGRMAASPAMASQIPEMAKRLRANALALVSLVSEVLDIARFDSGKVELQESEFSLQELLEEECRQLLPLAQEKHLRLETEIPEHNLWLRTDRVKLVRILGNLLGNAFKFTEAGSVHVSTAMDPDRRVLIRIRDTGVGIATEHLSCIFDEFAQLRNPSRDRNQGNGLGLAISKRLIEVMGGTITVESTLGNGSTFTITLPSETVVPRRGTQVKFQKTKPLRKESFPPRGALDGLRVLLVEDHQTSREGTAEILRGEGVQVIEAGDGETALRFLREESPEVLLLDMMLPDMDGREILRQAQGRSPQLQAVVVMTGDLTPERLEEVKNLGADVLLEKPTDIQQLIGTLRSLRKTGLRPPEDESSSPKESEGS